MTHSQAIRGDQLQPTHRGAILLNSLRVEGQPIFYSILAQAADVTTAAITEDAVEQFKDALASQDTHFASTTNDLLERRRFRQIQLPGRSEPEGIAINRSTLSCCRMTCPDSLPSECTHQFAHLFTEQATAAGIGVHVRLLAEHIIEPVDGSEWI
ncbi:hypothetical protein HPB50_016396 [Hyalomma asiaticum]|uniref:Uncharacterized protein n=1 Tax=Hyalomma asiaticum TaxID=266040 RepID=A0ACB7RVR0_HYAAI|nr:hypothetical protein HPB50_016396 [Hyalomma asiaticum]